MQQYRKKPVVIEAMQFDGTREVAEVISEWSNRTIYPTPSANELQIPTLEGTMTALQGDYIIKGLKGEFYPCKPDIFEQTYSQVGLEPPSCLTFDIALQRLKLGHKVTRAIWNNPDVFLTINHRGKDIPVSELWSTKIREQLVANGTKKVKVQGNIMMLRQDGTIGMYEPNTEDVLAEDWIMLD